MHFIKNDSELTIDDLNTFNYPNKKLGVIIHIFDKNGKILLQKRGIESNDEKLMYEDVGGKFEKDDITFKNAIIREMKEEMGNDCIIENIENIGIYHVPKNGINWVFVIYKGTYINGPIKIMEPLKCSGYKFFEYEDIINNNKVSNPCKYLVKEIKKNYYI